MSDPSVQLIFGPMLLGVLLNSILYGTLVVQTLVYFQTYKGDPRWFKMFVFYLLFCETLNTASDIGVAYEPLVIRYGTPRAVTVSPIMLPADPLFTVLVSMPVQLFIAWRIKIMSKSMIVPTIITFFAICSFVGGVATAISVSIITEYAHFEQFWAAPIIWLAASAVADILITTSLVLNLSRQRTGFALTDDLINRTIRLTVQTGMITSLFASIDIVLFLTVRGTLLFFIFDFTLAKLYSNSLLSTLNARKGWKTTATIRDNVLFGNGSADGESMVRGRTQIEFVATDARARRLSNIVPMMVFEPGAGDHHGSALNVTQKVCEENENLGEV